MRLLIFPITALIVVLLTLILVVAFALTLLFSPVLLLIDSHQPANHKFADYGTR